MVQKGLTLILFMKRLKQKCHVAEKLNLSGIWLPLTALVTISKLLLLGCLDIGKIQYLTVFIISGHI